ncbi:MAG TPA: beta family protein [Burkholderiaceae bacterium]|nr:beta family protein [Burkholderiaceae bacterium]
MSRRKRVLYVPALRMKVGELEGLRALREDVANCIIPLLIVPPAKDRSNGVQPTLFPLGQQVPDVGSAVRPYWVHREAFIDPRVLLTELEAGTAAEWLPKLFHRARSKGVFAIPTADLLTLGESAAAAFKRSIDPTAAIKFGLRVQSADLSDPDLDNKLLALLADLGVVPSECAVVLDFCDADLSAPELVEPIIRAALEQMQTIGQWQLITFLGTHFPERNPAKPDQSVIHPRNEWLAWVEAVKFDPTTAEYMVFGDFAADCAKLDFKGQGGRPIPHTRYTTPTKWLIVRGDAEGATYKVMRQVFSRILKSGHFAGARFSTADAYIYDVATGLSSSAGNATTWRQLNTTHHITQVVADIASVRRIGIARVPAAPAGVQQEIGIP